MRDQNSTNTRSVFYVVDNWKAKRKNKPLVKLFTFVVSIRKFAIIYFVFTLRI